VTDYRPIEPAAPRQADGDERLDRVLTALERLRAAAPADDRDAPARLASASAMLDILQPLTPDVAAGADGPWDTANAVAARVVLELYAAAVRDLRAVSTDSRRRVEQVDVVFAEARDLALQHRRKAERLAKKRRLT
jgi:hypothetical protein